jgi:hypothetical protein
VIVVVPAVNGVTTPLEETVATVGSELIQVPPVVVLARVPFVPIQSALGPVIAAGVGYTTTLMLVVLEQPLAVVVYT